MSRYLVMHVCGSETYLEVQTTELHGVEAIEHVAKTWAEDYHEPAPARLRIFKLMDPVDVIVSRKSIVEIEVKP